MGCKYLGIWEMGEWVCIEHEPLFAGVYVLKYAKRRCGLGSFVSLCFSLFHCICLCVFAFLHFNISLPLCISRVLSFSHLLASFSPHATAYFSAICPSSLPISSMSRHILFMASAAASSVE